MLFWRGDHNAPIQVLQAEVSETVLPLAANPVEDLKVYLTGAVVNPGVYSLSQGDRVSDALAAAGGATDDAQSEPINLALRVQGEGHYHIPRLGEAPSADSTAMFGGNQGAAAAAPGICDGLIDLNTASAQLLETLPNSGEVRAAAVVSYRNASGGFQAVEDVTNVSGIGPAIYAAIQGLATVCDPG